MKFSPQVLEEVTSSGGMTHRLDFSYADIPAGVAAVTANTVWPITLPMMNIGDIFRRCEMYIGPGFASTAFPALTDTKLSLGDTGSAARYLSAVQVNATGLTATSFPGALENFIYTAALRLVLTLTTATASRSVSELNSGKGYILIGIDRSAGQGRVKAPPFGPGTTATN